MSLLVTLCQRHILYLTVAGTVLLAAVYFNNDKENSRRLEQQPSGELDRNDELKETMNHVGKDTGRQRGILPL